MCLTIQMKAFVQINVSGWTSRVSPDKVSSCGLTVCYKKKKIMCNLLKFSYIFEIVTRKKFSKIEFYEVSQFLKELYCYWKLLF